MGRPDRTPPTVPWGQLLVLTVGMGLAAASGIASRDDVADAGTADVLPAAVLGAAIAAVVGVTSVRSAPRSSVARVLGAPVSVLVVIACGTLTGIMAAGGVTRRAAIGTPSTAEDPGITSRAASSGPLSPGTQRRSGPDITDLQGSLILVVGLVMLIGAVVFFMRRSELREVERNAVYLRSDLRLLDDEPEPDPDATAVIEALGRSLDELLAHSDPRVAICAAYGALLNAFATIGVPRRPYEGPGEHIGRCLSAHPMPADSIDELLRLFQVARFSALPVTAADAARARRLLGSAIEVVAGAPA